MKKYWPAVAGGAIVLACGAAAISVNYYYSKKSRVSAVGTCPPGTSRDPNNGAQCLEAVDPVTVDLVSVCGDGHMFNAGVCLESECPVGWGPGMDIANCTKITKTSSARPPASAPTATCPTNLNWHLSADRSRCWECTNSPGEDAATEKCVQFTSPAGTMPNNQGTCPTNYRPFDNAGVPYCYTCQAFAPADMAPLCSTMVDPGKIAPALVCSDQTTQLIGDKCYGACPPESNVMGTVCEFETEEIAPRAFTTPIMECPKGTRILDGACWKCPSGSVEFGNNTCFNVSKSV